MSLDVTLVFNDVEVYEANITHNLRTMASSVDIYKALWRPEEIEVERAGQIIECLIEGLKELKRLPEYYSQYNSPNGWGMYEHFVPFVEQYLEACIRYPEAIIHVSR